MNEDGGTTDDPVLDSLGPMAVAKDNSLHKVLPSWRPDKSLQHRVVLLND